jgi:hypothetical protein
MSFINVITYELHHSNLLPVLNGKYLVLRNEVIALAGVELRLETAHKGQGVMHGLSYLLVVSVSLLQKYR